VALHAREPGVIAGLCLADGRQVVHIGDETLSLWTPELRGE